MTAQAPPYRDGKPVLLIDNALVYCVLCMSEDEDKIECVHIFSTKENAERWAKTDPRNHVFYDYAVDAPARFEDPLQ